MTRIAEEVQLQKLPPQNLEAEQMVLGAVMIDNNSIDKVIDILEVEDFYKDVHRRIWAAMVDMSQRFEAIDLITLTNEIKGKAGLESVGGASYLAYLVSLVPTSANIKNHARIVRDKAILRRLLHGTTDIQTQCYDDSRSMTVDQLLDKSQEIIFGIAQKKRTESFTSAKVLAGESQKIIEHLFENKGQVTGLASGFVDLDKKLTGFQPADLIIVAARPSMGKTALCLNVAAFAAIEHEKKVAIFSLEMSKEQLMLRLICSEARVDSQRVRTGFIQERDWPALSNAVYRISESELYIDDTAALTDLEVRSRSRRLKAEKGGLDLIIVDYLQLMRGSADANNREQEIANISRSLKALAKELRVPVMALSQLNRAVETRGKDKRPMLSDLRESGAIEQDADVILFIYRQEVYKECDCPQDGECLCGRRGTAEVIIGKQRNGPIGKVDLTYLKSYTRFENSERPRR